jgi:hypothetical protein
MARMTSTYFRNSSLQENGHMRVFGILTTQVQNRQEDNEDLILRKHQRPFGEGVELPNRIKR